MTDDYAQQGGLIANMIMAVIVLGRRYSIIKYISVVMITIGTIVCTIASAEKLVSFFFYFVGWRK